MTTQYPAKIDTAITLPKVIDNTTVVQGKVVNDLRDAILAIEDELGVKPSSVYGTVKARLDYFEAVINQGGGGGSQTLAEVLALGNFSNGTDILLNSNSALIIQQSGSVPTAADLDNGVLWVKDTSPTTLIFTDSSGADTTLGSGGGGSQTLAQVLTLGNITGGTNIQVSAGDAIVGIDGGSTLNILGGAGAASGDGGSIYLQAGNGGATNGNGGSIDILSGSATTDGYAGHIHISSGISVGDHDGGIITITSSDGSGTGNGGEITITAGSGVVGGNITLNPGSGTTNGVVLISGNGAQINFDQVSSAPSAPNSGRGGLWVKNTSPTTIIYTDSSNIDNTISPFEITPTTLSADQNDYNPTNFADARTVRLDSGSTAVTITGLESQVGNLSKKIINVGSAIITFTHEDTSSSAVNRIHNQASADFILNPDQVVEIYYDTTIQRWRFTLVAATGGLTFISTTSSGTDSSETHVSIGVLSSTITRDLPATPNTGDVIEYKAPSNAITFNITIDGNGKTIDGSSTFILNANYMAIKVTYNGTEWEIS